MGRIAGYVIHPPLSPVPIAVTRPV